MIPQSRRESTLRDQSLVHLLRGLIIYHGAWSYLPIMVVGAPAGEDNRKAVEQLGVSCYLPEGGQADRIAKIMKRVLLAVWWSGEKKRDVPAFVISPSGQIYRANEVADRHFGPGLVGRQFNCAVEGLVEEELPKQHPLRRASDDREVLSEDHTFKGGRRYYLFATPLHTPQKRSSLPVALWLFEASRWPTLVEAASAFAVAPNREKLFQAIVEQAKVLGFTRSRLYEAEDGYLCGCASIGFLDEVKAAWFKEWRFAINDDVSSQETMVPQTRERQKARMWEPECDLPSTELIRRFPGRANFKEELEKDEVRRWVEAPIWLPPTGRSEVIRPWGKLSLDRGKDSNTLAARDADTASQFANVVGHAIAQRLKRDEEEDRAKEIRECSIELNKLLSNRTSEHSLLDQAVKRILQTFLKVVGGEVALYRELHQESGTLKLVGKEEYANVSLETNYKVPAHLSNTEPLKDYFALSSPEPSIEAPRDTLATFLAIGREFTEGETRYLKDIRSEIRVPVLSGDKIRGAIFVVSIWADAFDDHHKKIVEGLMHIVGNWLDLARHREKERWTDRTLRSTIQLLSKLASIPSGNDEAFFAAMATLLSSGNNGLGWNRVFVFSCHASVLPYTAELVYALGGKATPDEVKMHQTLHKAFAADNRFDTLEKEVEARIKAPPPHYRPVGGGVVRDALYESCIEVGRKESPIRVYYGPERRSPEDESIPAADNPIRALLDLDVTPADIATPEHLAFHLETCPSQWVVELLRDDAYHGTFNLEPNRVDAFALWSVLDGTPEPLGVVLLDLQVPVQQERVDMLAATRIFLGLVANILAARILARRLQGGINSLETVKHRRTLRDTWNGVKGFLDPLIEEAQAFHRQASIERHDGVTPTSGVPEQLLPLFFRPMSIDALERLRDRTEKQITRLEGMDINRPTTAIVEALEELKDYFQGRPCGAIQLDVFYDQVELQDVLLPCDQQVLRDTLTCLLTNSDAAVQKMIAAKSANSGTVAPLAPVVAELHARWEPCKPGGCFTGYLVLDYTDNGPGIHQDQRDRVFLDGFTSASDLQRKGRGLTFLLTLLLANRGIIQAVEPDPLTNGARFRITFGILFAQCEESLSPPGVHHGQAVDC
jgi:signal transduction histidine kinase